MKVKGPKAPVRWNGTSYDICLPWPDVPHQQWLEVVVTPQVTYVVRLRESGTDKWLVGVETPLTSCTFLQLKPNTEYEMEVRAKNADGETAPAVVTCRTGPDGAVRPLSVSDI